MCSALRSRPIPEPNHDETNSTLPRLPTQLIITKKVSLEVLEAGEVDMEDGESEEENNLPEGHGFFLKLATDLGLMETVAVELELISFGITADGHFSECVWVIERGQIFAFDTASRRKHFDLVQQVVLPFAQYLARSVLMTNPAIQHHAMRKDHDAGIAKQASDGHGANVCAFSSALVLGKVLGAVVGCAEESSLSDGTYCINVPDLADALAAMVIHQPAYLAARKQCAKQLSIRVGKYQSYLLKERQEGSGPKRQRASKAQGKQPEAGRSGPPTWADLSDEEDDGEEGNSQGEREEPFVEELD